jgi:GT2 family glycosyltransferase
MPLTSICTVTLNRFDLAVQCLVPALQDAGSVTEFLSWDNGSTDERVLPFLSSLNPVWSHSSPVNIGYAKAVNQMLLRAHGKYVCILDPDIQLPKDWLHRLVTAAEAIPDGGVSGIHCVEALPPVSVVNGQSVHVGDVFGVKFFRRELLEKVGYLCEDYGLYGLEDRDHLNRVSAMGFRSYYVAGLKSVHAGDDCSDKGEYRMGKWAALKLAFPIMQANLARYAETGNFYVPPTERLCE